MIKKAKSIHNLIFPGQCHDESWIFHFYVGLIEKKQVYTMTFPVTDRDASQSKANTRWAKDFCFRDRLLGYDETQLNDLTLVKLQTWTRVFFKQVNMVKVPLQGHFVIFQQLSCSKSYMSCLLKMFFCCLVVLWFLHVFFLGIGFIYLGHQVSCCLWFPL